MRSLQHPAATRTWRFGRGLALAACCALTLGATACGKDDPEEQFRLWCNNEAGWTEIGNYVANKDNDLKLRVRALELLAIDGHPSEVMKATEKAPDREKVFQALQPLMFKLLQDGNPKRQGYGKRVLFEMIKEGGVGPAQAKEIRSGVAKWAFGDLSHDSTAEAVKEKMKDRLIPTEIEALGSEAAAGAEIMIGKGISKAELVAFLRGLNTPESKSAIIGGLRRYHMGKKVKITDQDLGAIQWVDNFESYVYLLELYRRFSGEGKVHPDDKQAAELAIRVAVEWTDPADKSKKPEELEKLKKDRYAQIKAGWDRAGPLMDQLLKAKNCDDRWYAAQILVAVQGAKGLQTVLADLPADENYGQSEYSSQDTKMMLSDLCIHEVKDLGAETARPVLAAALTSAKAPIARVVAARCLAVFGDAQSVAALKSFDKKDPLANYGVQPIIVSEDAATLADVVQASLDTVQYCADVDKQAAEGKIDAKFAGLLRKYATYSVYRKGAALSKFAEERAKEKVEKDKAKNGN